MNNITGGMPTYLELPEFDSNGDIENSGLTRAEGMRSRSASINSLDLELRGAQRMPRPPMIKLPDMPETCRDGNSGLPGGNSFGPPPGGASTPLVSAS